MKEYNFAINGCWDILASSTGLLVMVESWMESSAGMLLFHPILIGVHTGGGLFVKLLLLSLVSVVVSVVGEVMSGELGLLLSLLSRWHQSCRCQCQF